MEIVLIVTAKEREKVSETKTERERNAMSVASELQENEIDD